MIDRKVFAEGADEYRPVLMWFWNDRIDEAEIRRQIDEFASQRIYQFFIHPLSGIEEQYLSDRFFGLIEAAADYARKLGMKFWIYDEYNWPSGCVGGELLRDYPQFRMLVVRYRSLSLSQGQSGEVIYPGRFISAQAVYGNEVCNISSKGTLNEDERTFVWRNPEVRGCRIFVFSEEMQGGVKESGQMSPSSWNQEGYLDTLNPAAVRKFLDMTHERYAARVGAHFGTTIPGVFTDEVALTNPVDCGPDTIPWTQDFQKIFYEENGYDLTHCLCELVMETGNYRRTRYDYWHSLTERFSNSYAKQVKEWCDEHRLLLTGHCCAEEHLAADLLQSGNTFMLMQHYHIPGIDSIFSKQHVDNENFNFAGKMVTSLAEHTGALRTLCETYTGSGWDLTLEEMKRIFHRLALLGVNLIQFMGAYYSLRGLRKRLPTSYPPSHSFQAPTWPYYGLFSDYISRICYANSRGVHGADIAVLMPAATIWCEYALRHDFFTAMGPDEHKPYGDLVITERTVHGLTNALLQIQRDFDLLHEPSLLEAEIEDGVLRFRGHEYRQLIIPSLIVLTSAIWDKLKRFILAGGRVCFVNLLPEHSPDRGNLAAEIEETAGLSPSAISAEVRTNFERTAVRSTRVSHKGTITHIVSNELVQHDNSGLRSALQQCLAWNRAVLSLSVPCDHVFIYHRKQEDTDLFLIANDTMEAYSGSIHIYRKGKVTVHDPETGITYSVDHVADDGNQEYQEIGFPLAGLQALVVEVSENGTAAENVYNVLSTEIMEIDLNGSWEFAPTDGLNYLRLDMEVALAVDGEPWGDVTQADGNSGRKWRPVQDWAFPGGIGFELGASYDARTTFIIKDIPQVLELAVDPEQEETIWINGVQLKPARTGYVWDRTNVLYNIAGWVRLGENRVVIRGRIPQWGADHTPVFAVLRGTFGVDHDRALTVLPEALHVPGSWNEQGFPDFSGIGVYRRKVDITHAIVSRNATLHVLNCRDVVKLWCNGEPVYTSLWNPHYFQLTGRFKKGNNILELKVANTLANMLEKPQTSGLSGAVKLIVHD